MPPIGVRIVLPKCQNRASGPDPRSSQASSIKRPSHSKPMNPNNARALGIGASVFALAMLSGCGGGSTKTSPPTGGSPVSAQVSGANPAATPPCSSVPSGTGEVFTPASGIQPQIAAIPGGAVVGVWEQDRWQGQGGGLGARAIAAARSIDSGASWSAPMVLPFSACAGASSGLGFGYDRASDPWVTFAGSGVVLASALAFSATGVNFGLASAGGQSAVLVSRSADGGSTWSTPMRVINDTNLSCTPACYFNDRDSITADPASGRAFLVWDRLSTAANTSNPAYLALSTDGGITWTPGQLYDPGTNNEAFNNQIAVLPNGTALDFFTLVTPTSSQLQVVSFTTSGTSWSMPTMLATIATITSVGTPNPIGSSATAIRDSSFMAQIALDPASGAIAAVWQQSFSSTATFDGIALSVSTNGGTTWSAPKQVNGVKTAAAFSPTVRYLPGSVLAITYYDFRDYVAGSSVLNTSAWLSESSDGGTTWHELRLQSPFDLNKAPLADTSFGPALFLGDNQGLALVGSNPLPLYAATTSAGAHVYATQSPSPLSSSSAHVYTASVLGVVPAAAAAKSQANLERMRLRGVPTAAQQ
jgi:hypothetical protein